MIAQNDIDAICSLSQKFNARKVILFGSSVQNDRDPDDIDLGIEGVAPEDYYRYCGELMFALSKPVDIVDLSVQCQFTNLVRQEGIVLYG
jgi:uncharacterized protein